MLEPPSDALVAGLAQLGLCRPADWRRARSRVRKLARDLPAFDSVWIDALVTLGRLTPYQAAAIEEGRFEDLQVGPCQLLDHLGQTRSSQTCLARHREHGHLCVVKITTIPLESAGEIRPRLQQLVERLAPLREPHVAGPAVCQFESVSAILVSPWIQGIPLSELLVRRGRFPAPIVADIARQLLAGLAALHQRQVIHGDVRLSNIRLTAAGSTVLVDAGVRPALSPVLQLHAIHSPEACDAVAPELIGTGRPVTPAADLYALGCVLWQLLAGRPPFPVADPLARLAAHQAGRVPDVRDLAPDTPAALADLIFRLTTPLPSDRPAGAQAILEGLGRPGLSTRQRLRRFRKLFDGAVPHLAAAAPPSLGGWAWTAAAVFLLSGLVVTLADSQRRNELLSIWADPTPPPVSRSSGSPLAEASPAAGSPDDALRTMPEPDAQGILTLDTGTYAPRDLAQIGPLTVRAAPGAKPRLRISRRPWQITARELVLDGIDIEQSGSPDDGPSLRALVLTRNQSLTLANVSFAIGSDSETDLPPVPCIAWTQIDRQDRQAGQALLQNVTVTRPGPLLFCREAPRLVTLDNCLKTADGPAIVVYQSHSARPIRIDVSHSTLRGSGPLLSLWGDFAEQTGAARLEVDAIESVFAPSPASPALIELAAERLRPDWAQAILWTGESSLLPAGVEIVSRRDPAQHSIERLESTDVTVEGLTVDAFEFAGPALSSPADSRISASQAPRRSTELPGYRPRE